MANYIAHGLKSFYNKIRTDGVRVQHQFALQFGGDTTSTHNNYIQEIQTYAPVYAEGANLPGRDIITQDANYFGFPFKIPVNTRYKQTWDCTVKSDVGMKVRAAFEKWMNIYADLAKNTGGSKGIVPKNDYVLIHLLDTNFFNNSGSNTLGLVEGFKSARTYRLEGVFPSAIGDMAQSHGSNNIATFSMTFTFQYWFADVGSEPAGEGDPLNLAQD